MIAATKVGADVLTGSSGRFTPDTTLLVINLRYILNGSFPYNGWFLGSRV